MRELIVQVMSRTAEDGKRKGDMSWSLCSVKAFRIFASERTEEDFGVAEQLSKAMSPLCTPSSLHGL